MRSKDRSNRGNLVIEGNTKSEARTLYLPKGIFDGSKENPGLIRPEATLERVVTKPSRGSPTVVMKGIRVATGKGHL